MQNITTTADLSDAIAKLEAKHTLEEIALREKLQKTYESVQPVNLLKSTYQEVIGSPEAGTIKNEIIDTAIGLAVGYVSKKIFDGDTHSPVRKAAGVVVQLAVTNAVRNHPEEMRAVGKMFFNMLRDTSRKSRR